MTANIASAATGTTSSARVRPFNTTPRNAIRKYFAGTIVAGLPFGAAPSGIREDAGDFPGLDAFVLVDDANVPRFPPRDAVDVAITGGAALRAADVRQVSASALAVANRARAQIRRPVGSTARVTITVVDTLGNILGIVRTRDAPMFGAVIAGVSLLAACEMRFRPYVSPADVPTLTGSRRTTHRLTLAPGSAYLIGEPARSHFEHHIPAVAALRYSVTFRTIRAREGTAGSPVHTNGEPGGPPLTDA